MHKKRFLVFAAVVLLLTAGAAAAAVLGTVTLSPGQCVRIDKTRVCASRAQGATRTVTVVRTVTAAPPAPSIQSGHYVGTSTDGERFNFDVANDQVSNIDFAFNGECSDGGSSYGQRVYGGPFQIALDGTFSTTQGGPNASGGYTTITVTGRISADGSASGSFKMDGTAPGLSCSDHANWTSHLS